ncbi:MAG: sigma-54-dependent Fis family transcriptional regulator [Myxococcales bacterium]|nr:sigma-54-dependent Fis family transcriptional regulator [Myxococcales bacterium]
MDASGSDKRIVAVVDDDPVLRRMARAWLAADGVQVLEFADGHSALRERLGGAHVAMLDLGLGDMTGLDLFSHLRERDPELSVIVASASRDVESVVAAMRLGALDYLAKPLEAQRVREAVKRAFDRLQAIDDVRSSRVQQGGALAGVIGASAAMREVSEQVRRVLESDVTVCLLGESGVGKEVVARAIHENGRRHKGPFVAVNCAAIPASLQESELFGHERGAFTGANATHKGRFEQAQHGTLFLDELGEMSAATQAALLRTLQEKTVRRVGGTTDIAVNARIVCATHRDLEAEVEAGRFRKDLYYRLVVYPIEIRPLRERREDVPLLVGHFMKRLSADVGRSVSRVAPEALDVLVRYEWPGNVRELQNIVHRAMLSCDGDVIALEHLPASLRKIALPALSEPAAPTPTEPSTGVGDSPSAEEPVIPLAEVERRAIVRAMAVAQGSVGRAAKMLGIGRTTLYRRLNELGMPPEKP